MKKQQKDFFKRYIERYFCTFFNISDEQIIDFNDSVKRYYEKIICSGTGKIILANSEETYRFTSFNMVSKFLCVDRKKVKDAYEKGELINGFYIDKVD